MPALTLLAAWHARGNLERHISMAACGHALVVEERCVAQESARAYERVSSSWLEQYTPRDVQFVLSSVRHVPD